MKSLLPLSIVVAGALLATGIYLGLQSMRPPPAPVPTPAIEGDRRPSAPAPDPAATRRDEAQVLADATDAVNAALPAWRAACWDTADPSTRKPGRYVAALAFGPDGSSVVAGITEDRSGSDPGVAQCLRQRVHLLRIPPPQRPVSLEVPFPLP